MSSPNDRKYTRDHEWVMLNGKEMGITEYLVNQIGNTATLTLPSPNTTVAASMGEEIGSISVNSNVAARLHAPVSGDVDRNDFLKELLGEGPAGIRLVSSRISESYKGLLQSRVA